MEFLETKDVPPVIRGPIVESARRLKELSVSLERPMTLVFAPPGYGKTTLCASFCANLPANKYKTVWLNLDESDRDEHVFMFNLVTAVDRALPELELGELLGQRFDDLADKATAYEFLVSFANALSRSRKRPYIVLDNFDILSPESTEHVRYLARAVGSNASIVLVASSMLNLDLGDLLISGDLVEIGAQDLLMTQEETEFFLEENCGISFTEEQMQAISSLSSGCVSSLKIIATCFSEAGEANGSFDITMARCRARLQSFTLSRLLRMFDEQTVRFLMRVSFAPRFTVGLCSAIGLDWIQRETLNALKASGVVVERKVGLGSWYAIAQPYADTVVALRDQYLSREDCDAVCDALIDWYEDEEMFEDALELMILQKNDSRFISLFTRNMETLLQRNDGSRILELLGGMSETAATSNLATLLASAWASFTAGRPEESLGWLRYVFAGTNYAGIQNRADNPDYYDLWSLIKTIEACATSQMGDYAEGTRLSLAALDRLGSVDEVLADRANLWLWVTLWHNLGECYMLTGNLQKAYEALSTSRIDCIVARRPILYHFCSYEMGVLRIFGGNLKAAERLFKETLRAGKTGVPIAPTWALGLVHLGRVRLKMLAGNVAAAREEFDNALELVGSSANIDGYLECMMVRCLVESLEGNAGFAQAAIREAYNDATSASVPRGVAIDVVIYKAVVDLNMGNMLSAQHLIAECAGMMAPDDLVHQIQHKGLVAYYHAMRKEHDEALAFLEEAQDLAEQTGCRLFSVALATLKAGLFWDAGRKGEAADEAVGTLIATFEMNAPSLWTQYGGYAPVRSVLEKLLYSSDPVFASRRHNENSLTVFAQKCLELLGGGAASADDAGGASVLTPKELSICDMIIAGKTRKEIADELGVSENTVKTHARSVYRKLGVHSNKELKAMRAGNDGSA